MTRQRRSPNWTNPRPFDQSPGTVPPMPTYEEMQRRWAQ